MQYKYQNVSGMPQTLVGFGHVEPNGIIETAVMVENPNFKLLSNEAPQAPVPEGQPQVVAVNEEVIQ